MKKKSKSHILIVDDQDIFLHALSNILEKKYKLSSAKTGREALEKAKMDKPDLILLDIIMPDMSGFDVLSQLKEIDGTRSIPVICITARDCVEDEEKGFALGATDYITKPFHNSIVEARVSTQIQMIEYIQMVERMCMVDALTNIANRRNFDKRLDEEWERACRNKTPLSMLMLDIDKFKKYNDIHGHPQGDVLLIAIAETIEQALNRPADFAARWGGEEFAVLLPDTNLSGALEVAERIRCNVEKMVIPHKDMGSDTKVAISIGVSSQIPEAGSLKDDLVFWSDKALYAAKKLGGNEVCFSNM